MAHATERLHHLLALDRRQALRSGSALLLSTLLPAACQRQPLEERVLDDLVRRVVAPELESARRACARLSEAATMLVATPGAPAEGQLRDALRRALLGWKRAATFPLGPLAGSGALAEVACFPVRREAIDEQLTRELPAGPSPLQGLGADLKGLYAIEYLTFEHRVASDLGQDTNDASRVRALIAACAAEADSRVELASKLLGPGGSSFAPAFVGGGRANVSLLVSAMATGIEHFVTSVLGLVLWLDSIKKLGTRAVEGGPSGVSHELALALLGGTERLYMGGAEGGLGALVKVAAPAIDGRLRAALGAAIGSVRALGSPIEQAVAAARPKVEVVERAVHALELALKVDLVSALGLTLTAVSADAD